jgi:ribonuclease BN (tRNA processing enzyme)
VTAARPSREVIDVGKVGMRLHVLGCSGSYPGPREPCSGYLLEATGKRIWLDAGGGTLAGLLSYCSLSDLDAIWISHLHPDHCTDLPLAINALVLGTKRSEPLPVLGPTGWATHMDAFLAQPGATATAFEVIELRDRQRMTLGNLVLEAAATVHGIETYGLRASAAGLTMAYSADSGPCPALAYLSEGSDLFLCEAGAKNPSPDAIHLTPEQAGNLAASSGARRLVLTHLLPDVDPLEARMRAARSFNGDVEVAVKEGVLELP